MSANDDKSESSEFRSAPKADNLVAYSRYLTKKSKQKNLDTVNRMSDASYTTTDHSKVDIISMHDDEQSTLNNQSTSTMLQTKSRSTRNSNPRESINSNAGIKIKIHFILNLI